MSIRFKLTTPSGDTSLFEHSGPVVRIGRDPSCELLLDGDDAGKGSSRLHARIELTPDRCQIVDTQSSNGTLLNTHRIDRPMALKPGDCIQIGYTGSTLTVLDLKLPARRSAAGPPQGRWLFYALAGGLLSLVGVTALLALVLIFSKRPAPAEPDQDLDQTALTEPGPDVKPVPVVEAERKSLPAFEVKTVGHYLRRDSAGPSVLLQRAGETDPWSVLRSGQPVQTSHTLLSLPGYESLVVLDSGLRLNLWGGLPELRGAAGKGEFVAPVLEALLMLNVPAKGVSADLSLERGRVEVSGSEQTAGARAVVRFLHEVWEVALEGADSKVCVELFATQRRLSGGEAERVFGLFSRGKVSVKRDGKTLSFDAPARMAWSSATPGKVFEEKLAAPPKWWAQPLPATPEVQDAALSLADWSKRLARSDDLIDTVQTVVRDDLNDLTDRKLGVWFLAALDEVSLLVGFLGDNNKLHNDVRDTAMYGLRDWLARNARRRESLTRLLRERNRYSPKNAALLVELLSPFSAAELADPATYQRLIDLLNHDKMEIRQLAAHHLYEELADRMPREALQVKYHPANSPADRASAVQKWHHVLPAGKLPSGPRNDPR